MFSKDKVKRSNELIELFGRAPIKKTFRMVLSYNDNLEAIFKMPHSPNYEHALGDTHGGIIATLLDNAGWFTAAVQYETWIATIEMQMRLLKPAGKKDLIAMGELIRAGRSFAVAHMKVQTARGRLVATGSGTFAITSVSTKGR